MNRLFFILFFSLSFSVTTNDVYDESWALIIGIDKYENIQDLNYAVRDAESVRSMMIDDFGFHKDNVISLINEEATFNNIRKQFSKIAKSAGSRDRVLIFFAGHGQTMDLPDGGEKGYLLPYEGEEEDLYLTAVPMDELRQIALMSKAKHILYLVDACYSGLATIGSRSIESSSAPNYIEKITKNKSRQIITAGGRGEQVIEKAEWGHSAFTLNLKRGLKDGNADLNGDDVITANELGMFLKEKVTMDSENQQTPQHGRMTSQEGEFIFINELNLIQINGILETTKKIMNPKIAIMDFEGIGIGIDEVRALTQRLASEIISLDVYQMLERSKIKNIIKEQNLDFSECVGNDCAIEMGKLVGADRMIVGTVSKIGDTYSIDSRMIEVESGEAVISAEFSTQNSIDDVITHGMESISYQLCDMAVPAYDKFHFKEYLYDNKGKIALIFLTFWIGWGLLPA